MSNDVPEEIQLKSGYFFSPGFYMSYWRDAIIANFDGHTVSFNGKLKQHREVWIGAHLAALKTKLSGDQYFVALPENDPPDILVGKFAKVTVPSGRVGHNLDWYPVENTRCDMSSGETLLGQINNKNTAAYTNTVLNVYLQGAEKVPDLKQLSDTLKNTEPFYPNEVLIMVQLQGEANGIPEDTFGFVQVYPNYDTALINRNDTDAFFEEPNVMKVTGRGIQSSRVRVGSIKLLPPNITNKNSKSRKV